MSLKLVSIVICYRDYFTRALVNFSRPSLSFLITWDLVNCRILDLSDGKTTMNITSRQ